MKRWISIAFALCIVVFSACSRAVETRHGTSLPPSVSLELQAIDSLMWQRPDSALMRLLPWFDTACRDAARHVSIAYDDHYAHLLLAELLYKNDFEQTNREDLRQAVAYFDSLVWQAPPLQRGAGGLKHTLPNPNATLFFLAARAHYINGVGYYERDSVVEACKEYLKALETMEGHFGENELVGHKARFMALTYNRLGDMFAEQFMMESAIKSYKNALKYCQTESTSAYGMSNIYSRLGAQYDMMGIKDSASFYYEKAKKFLPDTNNLIYRNILSIEALLSYQMNQDSRSAIDYLKYVINQTADEDEKLTRYLAIGDIFYEEKQYDSASFYLEYVYEHSKNPISKVRAADYLQTIYEYYGEEEKFDGIVRFLANNKKMDAENKSSVSALNELFQSYLEKRLAKHAELERDKIRKKTLWLIIIIVLAVSSFVYVWVKRRGKKLLKRQQMEADKALEETEKRHTQALEAERKAHQLEKKAISGRLKRSNQDLRELREQVKSHDGAKAMTEQASTFADEPICRLIRERVKYGQFLSQMDCTVYRDYALGKNHLAALRIAADRHFNQFTTRISKDYPELTRIDIDYCCLYLLGLTDADVAALMQRAYNTVNERSNKLKRIFGSENPIFATVQTIANGYILH